MEGEEAAKHVNRRGDDDEDNDDEDELTFTQHTIASSAVALSSDVGQEPTQNTPGPQEISSTIMSREHGVLLCFVMRS
jgi:hypothetical protein